MTCLHPVVIISVGCFFANSIAHFDIMLLLPLIFFFIQKALLSHTLLSSLFHPLRKQQKSLGILEFSPVDDLWSCIGIWSPPVPMFSCSSFCLVCCLSPLFQLMFWCSDVSLSWLPVIGLKVQTFQNNGSTLAANQTMVQFDPDRDQLFWTDQGPSVWSGPWSWGGFAWVKLKSPKVLTKQGRYKSTLNFRWTFSVRFTRGGQEQQPKTSAHWVDTKSWELLSYLQAEDGINHNITASKWLLLPSYALVIV